MNGAGFGKEAFAVVSSAPNGVVAVLVRMPCKVSKQLLFAEHLDYSMSKATNHCIDARS